MKSIYNYRVWDGNEMYYGGLGETRFYNKGRSGFIDIDTLGYLDLCLSEKRKVMQYTNLDDIAKRHIYIGDIVKDKHGSIGIVKWGLMGFVFDTNFKKGFVHPLNNGFDLDNLEVIGNIYENPELLN